MIFRMQRILIPALIALFSVALIFSGCSTQRQLAATVNASASTQTSPSPQAADRVFVLHFDSDDLSDKLELTNEALRIMTTRLKAAGFTIISAITEGEFLIFETADGITPSQEWLDRMVGAGEFGLYPSTDNTLDSNEPIVGNEHLLSVSETVQEANSVSGNQSQLSMAFNEAGTKRLSDATAERVGKTIAVVVDGQILINPTINSVITTGECIITLPNELASDIYNLLQNGQLPIIIEKAQVLTPDEWTNQKADITTQTGDNGSSPAGSTKSDSMAQFPQPENLTYSYDDILARYQSQAGIYSLALENPDLPALLYELTDWNQTDAISGWDLNGNGKSQTVLIGLDHPNSFRFLIESGDALHNLIDLEGSMPAGFFDEFGTPSIGTRFQLTFADSTGDGIPDLFLTMEVDGRKATVLYRQLMLPDDIFPFVQAGMVEGYDAVWLDAYGVLWTAEKGNPDAVAHFYSEPTGRITSQEEQNSGLRIFHVLREFPLHLAEGGITTMYQTQKLAYTSDMDFMQAVTSHEWHLSNDSMLTLQFGEYEFMVGDTGTWNVYHSPDLNISIEDRQFEYTTSVIDHNQDDDTPTQSENVNILFTFALDEQTHLLSLTFINQETGESSGEALLFAMAE